MRGRGQNYMMRSEKRPGYPNLLTPSQPKRSVGYQILTIVLLVLLWPVGLVLLWRRRLTWHSAVKLLATLLSLILLFLMLGAALWYPFEDERIRAVQDTVSEAIDQATDRCVGFFAGMGENLRLVVENGPQIGAAAGDYALGHLLDAIASPTPKPTPVPPMTLTPGDGDLAGIASMMNRPTPVPTIQPTATATVEVSANKPERPTPSSAFGSSTPVPPVTATPIPTATPTPKPTPVTEKTANPALVPPLEKVGDLLVWHTSNGKWYHKGSVCGSMSNAKQHSISSAVAKGLTACPYCHPIDTKWGKEDEPTVYVSSDKYWHTRTGCESNTEEWMPMLLEEACKDKTLRPCDACGAHHYINGVPEVTSTMPPATAAKTPEPQNAQPTEEPLVEDGLQLSQVTNGDALVYYSGNTSHYHRRAMCASSTTTSFQPHTLMDALLEGKIACPVCRPPEPVTE